MSRLTTTQPPSPHFGGTAGIEPAYTLPVLSQVARYLYTVPCDVLPEGIEPPSPPSRDLGYSQIGRPLPRQHAWFSRPPSRAVKFPVPVWFLCFRSTISAFTDLRDG